MAYPYIDAAELAARVSQQVLNQILDDDNDGSADTTPIDRVRMDASSKVAGYLRGIYDLDLVAASTPNEVKRLTLDVAVAYLRQRHPEYVRGDWEKLMKAAESDLRKLRNGETRLDVEGSPEPAANNGGTFTVGDPDTFDEDCYQREFADGFGDF